MSALNSCLWISGLSASGKTSIGLEFRWNGYTLLDGDRLRGLLNIHPDFTKEGRELWLGKVTLLAEFLGKTVGEVVVCLCQPMPQVLEGFYKEVHLTTPLNVCIERDKKGLYFLKENMYGVALDYPTPTNPAMELDTSDKTPIDCYNLICEKLDIRRNC